MRSRELITILILSALTFSESVIAQSVDLDSVTFQSGWRSSELSSEMPGNTGSLNFSNLSSIGPAVDTSVAHKRLLAVQNQPEIRMRGAQEAQIYSEVSPSVVMVFTSDGIGSGAIISKSGDVVTNWHVVEGYETVAVIYKPTIDGSEISEADVRKATVVRVDEVADLALLRVQDPQKDRKALSLGASSDIPVGSDVHAIGHPTGESWTYTMGIVSQKRNSYEWYTNSGKMHKAAVIQTQTPINPGNSGGPLLSDQKKLVGINSFKAEGEALNFAVSVEEVRRFLNQEGNRLAENVSDSRSKQAASLDDCEGDELGAERNDAGDTTLTYVDIDCDGVADGFVSVPDDIEMPIAFSFDSTGDGNIDIVYVDIDRDGQVDNSIHDVDADGEPDLLGYHRNGDYEPYKLEVYPG
jgi:S1-C subfamily serine protease